MAYPIDYKNTTVKTEFYSELSQVHTEAVNYLMSFVWCKAIINSYLYINLGSTLCVFLFEIDNTASKDDHYLWVIVGDIPPMYLDIYGPKTTKEALEDYVKLAEDWTKNVKSGKSLKNNYPFKAEPTFEMAELLEKRVAFIKKTVISNIENIPLLIK